MDIKYPIKNEYMIKYPIENEYMIKYPIENEYMNRVLQINEFSGPRPRVQSSCQVGSGQGGA